MRAVDLNKDGLTDIVVLDYDNKCLKVYLGDAALAFTKNYKCSFSQASGRIMAVADFDVSGKPDVAIASTDTKKPVSIFFNRGNGQLNGKPLSLASSTAVSGWLPYGAAADLDGNGQQDILAQDVVNQMYSFLNQGNKKFAAGHFIPGFGYGFAAEDFDGDKKDDFFLYDSRAHKVNFFKGLGNGTFLKRNSYKVEDSSSSCDLYAADLNRDNKMDLVGQGKGLTDKGENWAFLGRGNGTLGTKKLLPGMGSLMNGAAITDLDGDGNPDLAAAEADGLWVYAGNGTGAFGTASILGEGLSFVPDYGNCAQGVGWGHFNGDLYPDLVGANAYDSFYNLVVFQGGLTPATLTISNLAVTNLTHSTNRIAFAGSFNYTGTNCVFKYLLTENHPAKSVHLMFQFKIDLDVFGDLYVTYTVTGAFLEGLNQDAGTLVFNLDLPSPVSVGGFIPVVTLLSFRLVDFNLVRSNSLQLNSRFEFETPGLRSIFLEAKISSFPEAKSII
jgi:hypothetical protein